MPIFTVGAAGTSTSAYAVDNSLRFSEDSGDYLRNPASGAAVAAERKTLTFSLWVKRAKLGSASSTQYMICGIEGTGNYYSALMFNSTDQLRFFHNESGTTRCDLKTNRVFRDPSAWYHIVLAIDTTQGTDSNRVKIYVNGVQETSFATETYYSSSFNTYFGMTNDTDGYPTYIGSNASSDHFDGYMAEVVGVGGSQLAASDFAESDSDTGIWKPKDLSDLSYGSGVAGNFLLQFQTSGTLGDDTSGNNNDFTVTNLTSIDQTTDTPTNNFCTLNPLRGNSYNVTFSEGNLKSSSSTTNNDSAVGTIGVTSGKWYWEAKMTSLGTGNQIFGVREYNGTSLKLNEDGTYSSGLTPGSTAPSGFSQGEILSVALDLDSATKTIQFYTNGSTNGDPMTLTGWDGESFLASIGGNDNYTMEWNFGNPPYSISSGNSDGNGYGNFEYSVPSGYYALCTKNLAEFG